MKTQWQHWKNSAQQSNQWVLHSDIIFWCQCQKMHLETIDETGISESLNHSEMPLPDQFSKPRKSFETAPFWSHWSYIRRDQWKRKWLRRRKFHWDTPMETLQQSILKHSSTSITFLQWAFQAFQVFQFEMQFNMLFQTVFLVFSFWMRGLFS